jgi:hypothetical protein
MLIYLYFSKTEEEERKKNTLWNVYSEEMTHFPRFSGDKFLCMGICALHTML